MAKQRIVNTRFWDDDYTSNLDPIEKLLFLYFLTNTSTNICGVYEIPLKKIANETGLDKEMVIKIIKRFSKEKKIFYQDGWVIIKNFIKHQNTKNPKILKGIEIELQNAPEHIRNIAYVYPMDSLSHSNSNLNTNSNTNLIKQKEIKSPNSYLSFLKEIPEEVITEFIEKFKVEKANIITKANALYDYCEAKGKRYKNYKAFLANTLRKDFGERPPKTKKPVYELVNGMMRITRYE
jgi:predicted regulator of amino acid metabolism with ACT domain